MEDQDELLFLSNLYKTWPWYLEQDNIIQLQKRIILSQHREIVKMKSKKDLIPKQKNKIKRKKSKLEFRSQIIE